MFRATGADPPLPNTQIQRNPSKYPCAIGQLQVMVRKSRENADDSEHSEFPVWVKSKCHSFEIRGFEPTKVAFQSSHAGTSLQNSRYPNPSFADSRLHSW